MLWFGNTSKTKSSAWELFPFDRQRDTHELFAPCYKRDYFSETGIGFPGIYLPSEMGAILKKKDLILGEKRFFPFNAVEYEKEGLFFPFLKNINYSCSLPTISPSARNEVLGQEAIKKLNEEGLHPKFHQLDITDKCSLERLKNFLQTTYGGLDVLVNNAGILFKVKVSV